MKEQAKNLHLRLPLPLHNTLAEQAREQGRSLHGHILYLLKLESAENKRRMRQGKTEEKE